MKKAMIALAVALLMAGSAHANEGKLLAVDQGSIVVDMGSEAVFKSGAKVKINGRSGTVTAVDGAKLTIKVRNTTEWKSGDAVKVERAPQLQGC